MALARKGELMSKRPKRLDDRAWVDAVDHDLRRAPRRRRVRAPSGQGRYVFASAIVLALLVAPFAVGATGDVLREGKRNPSHGAAGHETKVIAKAKTYGTRQSNVRSGDGGGAIYGCRSKTGREPCIRANNLNTGRAFEFATKGDEGGAIEVKNVAGRPFTTNATGVATGLNADRVDGLHAAKVDFRAATGTTTTEILNFGGLILHASCAAGPDLDVRADTTVVNSTIHVAWNKDPGNLPFYRQANDLDPGANFAIMSAGNDDSAQGTLVYSSPTGSTVSLTFQAEEGNAFANTTDCLFAGTAMAG
jgi:hypothetical protein